MIFDSFRHKKALFWLEIDCFRSPIEGGKGVFCIIQNQNPIMRDPFLGSGVG